MRPMRTNAMSTTMQISLPQGKVILECVLGVVISRYRESTLLSTIFQEIGTTRYYSFREDPPDSRNIHHDVASVLRHQAVGLFPRNPSLSDPVHHSAPQRARRTALRCQTHGFTHGDFIAEGCSRWQQRRRHR